VARHVTLVVGQVLVARRKGAVTALLETGIASGLGRSDLAFDFARATGKQIIERCAASVPEGALTIDRRNVRRAADATQTRRIQTWRP
jgi:hypothetical protein